MDISDLNDGQREVVKVTEGALAVLAGPGSGKTKTVISKIGYLISEVNVFPNHIWAMTFTNKATDEMTARLKKSIGKDADRVNIGTLHKIAYRIYKNATQSYMRKQLLVKTIGALSHLYAFLRNLKNTGSLDAKEMLDTIGRMKLDGVTVSNFTERRKYGNLNNGKMSYNETLHRTFIEYEAWKEKCNKMDFNDILINALAILKSEKHARYVSNLQDSVRYLIVDESQDTNMVCHEIIAIMTNKHKNIMLVGDLKQAIFGFQGGNVENVLGFIDRNNAKTVPLNMNYRSTKTIVENANFFMKGAKHVTEADTLTTPNEVGKEIKFFTNSCLEEESYEVMRVIDKLIEVDGYSFKDIGILYRLHAQAVPLEDLFILNEIPYITYTEETFFDRKEVIDILTYLDIAIEPEEATMKSIKRIANRPLRYISNKNLNDLENFAYENDSNFIDALRDVYSSNIDSKGKQNLAMLYSDISDIRMLHLKKRSPVQIARHILTGVGYEKWAIGQVKKNNPDTDIEMNFDAILSFLSPLYTVEEAINRVNEFKKRSKIKKDENSDAIKMMTIHASKGREFKVVIILGNCTTIYPFYKNDDKDEEQRLMYVAITRPQKELYFSVISGKYARKEVYPSPFLYKMNFNYTGGRNV